MVMVKLYHTLFKRTSTITLTIIAGAFVFERFYDQAVDNLFENLNRGVRKFSRCLIINSILTENFDFFSKYIVSVENLKIILLFKY